MPYTIGEIAKYLNIPSSTLRFYDKMGLMPFVTAPKAVFACSRTVILNGCSLLTA